ncbi:MAG: hypothetical protein C0410_04510 [Anaerolinea sp.]|nr:hypothetical protein [Anaerolinea sp.]
MAQNKGNQFMITVIKSPLVGLFGKGLAAITLKGRKTGKELSVPINIIEDTEAYTVISKRDRTWWRNLRGGTKVELWSKGQNSIVNGSVFEAPDEVRVALSQFFTQHANMAKYFKVSFNPDGSLNDADLDNASTERVVIKLQKPL